MEYYEGRGGGGGGVIPPAPLSTDYTRHLLQQISRLQQEVAELHAAAAPHTQQLHGKILGNFIVRLILN